MTYKKTCFATLLENCRKCRIWILQYWHFSPIFVLFKVTCLVTLVDRKRQASDFQTIFGIFLHTRYIGSSLCSQYFQMRLLERFSNTMKPLFFYYSETGGGFSGKLPANIAEIASSWTRGGFLQLIVILTSSITNHTVSEYLTRLKSVLVVDRET